MGTIESILVVEKKKKTNFKPGNINFSYGFSPGKEREGILQ